MRTIAALCAATALAWSTTAAGRASSSQTAAGAPTTVRVTLKAIATPATGASAETGSATADLIPGRTSTLGFATDADLCGIAIGGRNIGSAASEHRWTVAFTLLNAQIDKIALDVAVDRRDRGSDADRRDVRHLVLTEDAPHVIDFVEASDRSLASCPTKNIVVEVSAAITGPKAFARDSLTYDLWLTGRDASGREWTRHETQTGLQGEYIDFRFRPVRWPLQTLLASAPADLNFDENISGGIRARLRDDGTIDVSLATKREFVNTFPNGGWGSTGSDGGQKNFTVRAGEAVSLVLPAPSGAPTLTSADGTRTKIDYHDLFTNHTTAIVITINHERP